MKIALPDLISNSYFPAIAAVELGHFRDEGLDMELDLIFPVDKTLEAMRAGDIQFTAGSAHSVPHAFPGWQGAKLLGALAQNMYWFLVLRADLGARQGDLEAIKGLRIGAAPLVDLGLKQLLVDAGIDAEAEGIEIGPVPGAFTPGNVNFGVAAAKALEEGRVDGFWANGMGAEVAVTRGAGTIVIDARRGDGPAGAINYTMPALITTDALIEEQPEVAAAAVRALVKTQEAIKADVSLATEVAKKHFPETETGLIADIITRDLPYYTANVTPEFVEGMSAFSIAQGLTTAPIAYDQVVATQFTGLWNG